MEELNKDIELVEKFVMESNPWSHVRQAWHRIMGAVAKQPLTLKEAMQAVVDTKLLELPDTINGRAIAQLKAVICILGVDGLIEALEALCQRK